MSDRGEAVVSVAPDGRVAVMSAKHGIFGQFDAAGVWHDRELPTANEYMEDFGPAGPALSVIFLTRAKAASAAAKAETGMAATPASKRAG